MTCCKIGINRRIEPSLVVPEIRPRLSISARSARVDARPGGGIDVVPVRGGVDEPVIGQPRATHDLRVLGQVAEGPQHQHELGPLPAQLPARRAAGVGGRHDDLAGAGELGLLHIAKGDRHDALPRAQVDPVGGHGQTGVGEVAPALDGVRLGRLPATRVEVGLSAEEGGGQRQPDGAAGQEEAARRVVDGVPAAPHEQLGVAGGEHDLVGREGTAHRVDDGRDGVGAAPVAQGAQDGGGVPPHEVLARPRAPRRGARSARHRQAGGSDGDEPARGAVVGSVLPAPPRQGAQGHAVVPARASAPRAGSGPRPSASAAAEVPGTMSSARRRRSPAGSQ